METTGTWTRPLGEGSDTLIYIPNVNTPELLDRAISSVPPELQRDVVVVDSSPTGHAPDGVAIFRPEGRRSFTWIQNWAQREAIARKKELLVFMHADAQSLDGSLGMAIATLRNLLATGARFAGVMAGTDDAITVFHVPALVEVGPWDEDFAWYVSDIDYYYRVRLAGLELPTLKLPVRHATSATIKQSVVEHAGATRDQVAAIERYRKKWGGLWGHETLSTPYGS